MYIFFKKVHIFSDLCGKFLLISEILIAVSSYRDMFIKKTGQKL